MKNITFGAIAVMALTGAAQADTVINFIELPNEAGIHATGSNPFGGSFDVVKPNSEAFFISSPAVPGGYNPDAILSHIGISRSSPGFVINILEFPGGPISDQVAVYQFIPQFTVIDFYSDPAMFRTDLDIAATVMETGNLDHVFTYTNDRGEPVQLNVQSDTELVPLPPAMYAGLSSLAGVGLIGAIRRRRQNRA